MFWNTGKKYSTHPAYQKAYLDRKEVLKNGVSTSTFTVLDTETTGFDLQKDELVSIGAIKILNCEINIKESIEIHFPYSMREEREHIQIHQVISDKDDEESHHSKINRFLDFVGNSILVGHYIDYDRSMLNQAIQNHFGFKLFNPVLDTAQLAIRLEKGTDSTPHKSNAYGLDSLCERYGITPWDRHHAAGDAFLTALLLIKLLKLADKKGIRTTKNLLRTRAWN